MKINSKTKLNSVGVSEPGKDSEKDVRKLRPWERPGPDAWKGATKLPDEPTPTKPPKK